MLPFESDNLLPLFILCKEGFILDFYFSFSYIFMVLQVDSRKRKRKKRFFIGKNGFSFLFLFNNKVAAEGTNLLLLLPVLCDCCRVIVDTSARP